MVFSRTQPTTRTAKQGDRRKLLQRWIGADLMELEKQGTKKCPNPKEITNELRPFYPFSQEIMVQWNITY